MVNFSTRVLRAPVNPITNEVCVCAFFLDSLLGHFCFGDIWALRNTKIPGGKKKQKKHTHTLTNTYTAR